MTVTDDFDLPGNEQPPAGTPQQQSGSGLRQQLEAALAEKKAMADRVTALEAERRGDKLTSLVKGAGLPEAAAARYPADAEVTPEKVTEWANAEKAYAQQLTGTQPAPPTATQPGQPTPPVGVTPEAQAAAALVQTAEAGAQPPTEGLEGMLARLRDPSVSWPQLQQEMAAMGFKDA
jgi:hypothetical protein